MGADPDPVPPLSPAASADLAKRRRGRNVALLLTLLVLSGLFYVLAMVKLGGQG